jgi:hypothetical protein
MKITALGYNWPDTGRTYPTDAKLEIHFLSPKWADLVWYDKNRDTWVYISTLPIEKVQKRYENQ